MSRMSVGDASLTSILQRQGAFLKGEVQRASTEVVTGRQSDLGAGVRGDFSPLAAIDASLARLAGYRSTTADVAFFSQSIQTVMGTMADISSEVATSLMRSASLTTPTQVNAAAAEARARLGTAMAAMNTQVSGRSLFSGVESDQTPLGSADDLLTALQTAVSGATTANDVEAAVRTWFTAPGGYDAFYQGGAAASPIPIAAGETADLSVTALDPAFRDTLAGLAMGALLDLGLMSGQQSTRADIAQRAGLMLHNSEDKRALLAARIGTVEAQIEGAKTRNSAEDSALKIARSEIASVDPYDASIRLKEVQGQLESLYLITSRVSRLSLAEYIR
ncbi:flagellin [Tabrizicola sp.]|uniref:flagellin n=1 Tax=Tabrizicola sp. TaxID=2005166 RepID=UPI00286D0BAD|nr:flagellin [Tabrizicola sp.]